jgi:hypothetical protein
MSDMFNPPQPPLVRENRRKAHARLPKIPTTNEFGLEVPSDHIENYELGLNNNGNLWNPAGDFNYRENAKRKMEKAQAEYRTKYAEAKAKRNLTRNNKNGKINNKGNKGNKGNKNNGKTTRKLAFS